MGYRSVVTAIVYGDEEALTTYMTKEKLSSEDNVFTMFKGQLKHMALPFARKTVYALQLELEHVKWYDEYEDVVRWTQFMQQAPDNDLNYEFIRIGEDYDDIEKDEGGDSIDGLLYTTVSIEKDYPQPSKEELL
jgi:hypothetical protein